MRPRGADDTPGKPTAEQAAKIRAMLDSLRRMHRRGATRSSTVPTTTAAARSACSRSRRRWRSRPTRPKRSILFVWHTAEELGLLGSDWFTRHPTVPRDSIVAQLNIDMVGRGGPADIPGRRPGLRAAHRLAPALDRAGRPGRAGERRRPARARLQLRVRRGRPPGATLLPQRPLHVRPLRHSDHLLHHRRPPATTTSSPTRPQYIDFDKMARVAALVEDVARHVADLDHRVVVDKPKPDPEGTCKQ